MKKHPEFGIFSFVTNSFARHDVKTGDVRKIKTGFEDQYNKAEQMFEAGILDVAVIRCFWWGVTKTWSPTRVCRRPISPQKGLLTRIIMDLQWNRNARIVCRHSVTGDVFCDDRFNLSCLNLPVSENAKYAGIFDVTLLTEKG